MSSGPVVRRGVRFAEDDKDDQVPLGYILRIKKKRAEKAQFLKEERARQAIVEMERAAERRLHDAERMEWEREKKQWEAEKKAMEEEKRKQQYAEEVLLARQRREAARSGFYVPTPVRDTVRPQLRESKSNPDRNSSYLHPQRQASDFIPGSGSPYSESPTSSNPPSINGSLNGSGFFSRPESTASANTTLSSMEDVRQKKPASSRRASIIPDYPQQPMVAMPYFPMWGNPYAVPAVPMVAMPYYANLDLPLLPPTPPFMMQQSRRSQSPQSRSQSRSSSRQPSLPNNSSTDRLSISQRSTASAVPSRPDFAQHHRRQSSDDAVKSSRLAAATRRTGSTTDIHDRQSIRSTHTASGSRASVQLSHPPSSRSQGQWVTSTLPRGRSQQTVIT